MALTRSENMSRIRGRNTTPEVVLRKALWACGVRYRTDFHTPGGRADIAVPARKFAVFVDGCFWHGCPEHYVRPRSRNAFWDAKLRENVERDRRQTYRLIDEGWTAIRLWEHAVREAPDVVASRVLRALRLGGRGNWPQWRVVRVIFRDAAGTVERRYLEELVGTRTIGVLREAGFSYPMADHAWTALDAFVYGFTLLKKNFPLEPSEYAAAAKQFLPLIPVEQFPYLNGMSQEVIAGRHDGLPQIEFGLELILEGLERMRQTV